MLQTKGRAASRPELPKYHLRLLMEELVCTDTTDRSETMRIQRQTP